MKTEDKTSQLDNIKYIFIRGDDQVGALDVARAICRYTRYRLVCYPFVKVLFPNDNPSKFAGLRKDQYVIWSRQYTNRGYKEYAKLIDLIYVLVVKCLNNLLICGSEERNKRGDDYS